MTKGDDWTQENNKAYLIFQVLHLWTAVIALTTIAVRISIDNNLRAENALTLVIYHNHLGLGTKPRFVSWFKI